MPLLNNLAQSFGGWLNRLFGVSDAMRVASRPAMPVQPSSPAEMYDLLEAFYQQNSVYDFLRGAHYDGTITAEGVLPLRNPANRVIQFYSAHLWPGTLPDALPLDGLPDGVKGENLSKGIYRIYGWSNLGQVKQDFARDFAKFGDGFWKITLSEQDMTTTQKARIEPVDPRDVTTYEEEYGFLTYIRTDVSTMDTAEDGTVTQVTETQVWSKERQDGRIWRHLHGIDATVEQMGAPDIEITFASLGITFVPYVYTPLREKTRGGGAYVHALQKLFEADRSTTGLHRMQYRHGEPIWGIESDARGPNDSDIPPPSMPGSDAVVGGGVLTLGKGKVVSLPSGWHFKPLIPDIDYAAALAIIDAQVKENREDLPEMLYYELSQFGANISGVAVRLLLIPAIARLLEARGNAETGLIRATQMALTIAQNAGVPGYSAAEIGTYDAGDFAFHYRARDVIPLSPSEEADAVTKVRDIIGTTEALRELGHSESDITRITDEKAAAADAAMKRQQAMAPPPSPPATAPPNAPAP